MLHALTYILISLLVTASGHSRESSALTCNIITSLNGAGLSRDYEILERELSLLGHTVRYISAWEKTPIEKADINIFIEIPKRDFFPYARLNYFIPNPECYDYDLSLLSQFDAILCRTREVERIFSGYTPKTYFLGFTSIDRQDRSMEMNYQHCLHAPGQSPAKGTETVFNVWANNPDFPLLTAVTTCGISDPYLDNVNFINKRIPENELNDLYNSSGVHICPSETEGFGHYILEAMSAEAVVITTNAPPMNEYIDQQECLVEYSETAQRFLETSYHVDYNALAASVKTVLLLPEKQLQEIGKRNRNFYLEQQKNFRERLEYLLSQSVELL